MLFDTLSSYTDSIEIFFNQIVSQTVTLLMLNKKCL